MHEIPGIRIYREKFYNLLFSFRGRTAASLYCQVMMDIIHLVKNCKVSEFAIVASCVTSECYSGSEKENSLSEVTIGFVGLNTVISYVHYAFFICW